MNAERAREHADDAAYDDAIARRLRSGAAVECFACEEVIDAGDAIEDDGEPFCGKCHAAHVAQRNEDAAADAMERLRRLRDIESDLDDAAETHGAHCGCPICALRNRLWTIAHSITHPGFDSLWADNWRANGIRPLTYREVQP